MRTARLILVLVAGCASAVPQHGSFVHGQAEAQAALAADAAAKLIADYGGDEPPAIALQHPATDPFGRALAGELRAGGFRVRSGRGPDRALPLWYVADELKGTRLLRVVLRIDERFLSRAYELRGEALSPVGPWSSTGGQEP